MKVCLIGNDLTKDCLDKYYLNKLDVEVTDFTYLNIPNTKKHSIKDIRDIFEKKIYNFLIEKQPNILLITDAKFFKAVTKITNVNKYIGEPFYYGDLKTKIYYIYSYKISFYNPKMFEDNRNTVINSIFKRNTLDSDTLTNCVKIIPQEEINLFLNSLLKKEILAVDIESFSLKFYEAGLKSISFATSKIKSFSFEIDKDPNTKNYYVRRLLKQFFIKFSGKTIYHKANYDCTVLIYQLFMQNLSDYIGLLNGLDVILKNIEDTLIIAYLATNNTYKNELKLKQLALEYAGKYALDDIDDVMKIPLKDLLIYNGIDTLSTFYVYEKYYPIIVEDDQLNVYENLFKPSLRDVIHMQLNGLPINIDNLQNSEKKLNSIKEEAYNNLKKLPIIKQIEKELKQEKLIKKNSVLKKKQYILEEIDDVNFNFRSNNHVIDLLYKKLNFPIINKTDKGNPSTNKKTLNDLKEIITNKEEEFILDNLITLIEVSKLISDFIPNLNKAIKGSDGRSYIYGNFNLGGTISGRMSSNSPNLQNIPAGNTKYGKSIKECISAPDGWVLLGCDYTSLEDKINCIQTKDPNKEIIYLQGYDSHSYRAYYYFPNEIPRANTEIPTPEYINGIKKQFHGLRTDSKPITFLLTYGGNWATIVSKCGKKEQEAKDIENNYKKLYKVSITWKENILKQASKDGYVTCAFGLRLRTHILKQSVINTRSSAYAVSSEGRAAINAKGQSYSLLVNRACRAFMEKVNNSKFKYEIKPVANIHDALYLVVKLKPDVIKFVNDNLIPEFEWQDLPEIKSNIIKLGGELSMFYPDWSTETTIKNKELYNNILSIIKKLKDTKPC